MRSSRRYSPDRSPILREAVPIELLPSTRQGNSGIDHCGVLPSRGLPGSRYIHPPVPARGILLTELSSTPHKLLTNCSLVLIAGSTPVVMIQRSSSDYESSWEKTQKSQYSFPVCGEDGRGAVTVIVVYSYPLLLTPPVLLTYCSRTAHVLLTNCSCIAHVSLTYCSRPAHVLLTSCSRIAHVLLTSCSRIAH